MFTVVGGWEVGGGGVEILIEIPLEWSGVDNTHCIMLASSSWKAICRVPVQRGRPVGLNRKKNEIENVIYLQ